MVDLGGSPPDDPELVEDDVIPRFQVQLRNRVGGVQQDTLPLSHEAPPLPERGGRQGAPRFPRDDTGSIWCKIRSGLRNRKTKKLQLVSVFALHRYL